MSPTIVSTAQQPCTYKNTNQRNGLRAVEESIQRPATVTVCSDGAGAVESFGATPLLLRATTR